MSNSKNEKILLDKILKLEFSLNSLESENKLRDEFLKQKGLYDEYKDFEFDELNSSD